MGPAGRMPAGLVASADACAGAPVRENERVLPRHEDPIIAVATAPGRAAVGIVRVSGRRLDGLIEGLLRRRPAPRHATLLPFLDADGQPIDRGLAVHFPAPHSYTGEDVLELQAHGGPVILQLLVARCLEVAAQIDAKNGRACLPHLRLAQPGEFTERAFLNGKLDLAQAEAVADLIDASTEAAARSAGRALAGALSAAVNAMAEGIVALRALVEAALDFPEEDIEFVQQANACRRIEELQRELAALLERTRQGMLLREGMHVVLAGQPNVGKSSLLNALAGAELAIVTPIPGTTRDRVSQMIQIEGVPVHVVDTAGLRHPDKTADEVERIGIDRTWQAIAQADAIVLLHDATRVGEPDYDRAEARIERDLAPRAREPGCVLHVYNKVDIAAAPADALAISALTGKGLARLREELLRRAGGNASPEGVFIARARHVHALERCAQHLVLAQRLAGDEHGPLELLAEELRLAHQALGEITGSFTADELLGEIFGRFCIGK